MSPIQRLSILLLSLIAATTSTAWRLSFPPENLASEILALLKIQPANFPVLPPWPLSLFPLRLPFTNPITPSVQQPLKFKDDGTFHISIFEDLHFGENEFSQWGPQQDINSLKVINKMLDFEPDSDLIVLNGDLITGENTYLENATLYLDMIVGPIVDRGKIWASTYGNHDHNFNVTAETIYEREKLWRPNSRTRSMIRGGDLGTSNYFLPVYGSDCFGLDIEFDIDFGGNDFDFSIEVEVGRCRPELLLWFFDSKGGFEFQQLNATGSRIGVPDWVDAEVAQWWQDTNARIVARNGGRQIPSLAFVHIPTFASLAVQQEGIDPNEEPGVDDDNPLAPQAQGWCPDGRNDGTCDYGGQDVPFMEAITSIPGLMGVFSGHDHGATWCAKWEGLLPNMTVEGNGVSLCFGQHTGYGGYGNWERGARQIVVTEEQLRLHEIDTYIRLESGNIVGSVSLNATYGEDRYPATNDSMTYCPTCDYSK